MKILYGIQGTGNGHITRSLAVLAALDRNCDLSVDVLISGRDPEFLALQANDLCWRRGLTFVASEGKIDFWKTAKNLSITQLVKDIRKLDLSEYDLVVTDYEPVVSWAAKLGNKSTIGIGHQYAFSYPVPMGRSNFMTRAILRNFAPARCEVGLHWHHFNLPILPPIVDVDAMPERYIEADKIVVYLPFESPKQILRLLQPVNDHQFYVYHPDVEDSDFGHIHWRKTSRQTFKRDLLSSVGVICNTGFELISECLTLGTRVLTKPVDDQIEQLANAAALRQLDYATVVDQFSANTIRDWLEHSSFVRINYPRVQDRLAEWLRFGANDPVEALADELWQSVEVERGTSRIIYKAS